MVSCVHHDIHSGFPPELLLETGLRWHEGGEHTRVELWPG